MKLKNPCPYGWQSRGWIAGVHRGIDYGWYKADPAKSRQVFAAAPGIVAEVYNGGQYNQGWGSRAVIRHTDRAFTTYNHHPANGIVLKVGQQVDYGTFVGPMGNTGEITDISSHFELYIDGNRVDPAPYFSQDLPGNPVIAVPKPVLSEKDRLTVAIGVNARTEPTSLSAKVKGVPGNTAVTMQAFRDDGQNVQNNSRWFQSVEGHWYWSGGFTSTATTGLEDRTPVAPPPTVTVRFDNGQGVEVGVATVEVGATMSGAMFPQIVELAGFDFDGWLLDGEPFTTSTPVTANIVLVAAWEPEPTPPPEPQPVEPEEPDPTPVDPFPEFPEPTPVDPGQPDPPPQHAAPTPSRVGWIGGIAVAIIAIVAAIVGFFTGN